MKGPLSPRGPLSREILLFKTDCKTLEDDEVTMDEKGRLICKGKVLSQAAIEQRLRRFCAVIKNGKTLCGPEVKDLFDDLSKREELIEMWKQVKLNKDHMRPWSPTRLKSTIAIAMSLVNFVEQWNYTLSTIVNM